MSELHRRLYLEELTRIQMGDNETCIGIDEVDIGP